MERRHGMSSVLMHELERELKAEPADVMPEVPLAQICAMLKVTIDGLRRAGGDAQDLPPCGFTLEAYLGVLMDAGNSLVEMLGYILAAAHEPLWIVHCYYANLEGIKRPLGPDILLRAPDADTAVELAYGRRWSSLLSNLGCTWTPIVHPAGLRYENEHTCIDGSKVRMT